jgi:tetratricopeptide (TPR) repeat protein
MQMAVLSRSDTGALARKALEAPDDWRVQYWYGRRLAEGGKVQDAEQALRISVGTNPAYLPAATELGRVLLLQGRTSESFQMLKSVVGRDPEAVDAHFTLGQLYRAEAAYHRAMEEFQTVLKLRPEHVPARHELGECQVAIQQFSAAEATLREALKRDPRYGPALAALSRVRRSLGDLEEATALAQRAVKERPDLAMTHLELARSLAAKETPDARAQALEAISRAAAVDPNSSEVRFTLGELLSEAGRWREAREPLRALLAQQPGRTQALYLLSRVESRLGNQVESSRLEKAFRQGQEYDRRINELAARLGGKPDSGKLRFEMAEVHAKYGYTARAVAAYRSGLQREPHNPAARKRLAELLRLGLKEQAEAGP